MSKGYLYDNGEGLIIREGGSTLPTSTPADAGAYVIVGSDGNFKTKKDIYITAGYLKEAKRISFVGGITVKTIKETITNGGDVYLIFRSNEGSSGSSAHGAGLVLKLNYFLDDKNYLAVYNLLSAITVTEGVSQVLTYVSVSVNLSNLSDNSSYIQIPDSGVVNVTISLS